MDVAATAEQRPPSAGGVRLEREGSTRVLIMDHQRLNTIVHGIRAGLASALIEAELDETTDSVVVTGAAGNFCGGADLDEFARGTAMSPPSLHGHVIPFIEAMSKPVVAAIEGFALGGGLELALGCHARVADVHALVGLPETNFGLIPGAGGTVRLPRAVGALRAARMIVAAEVVRAGDLEDTALFDRLCDGDVRAAAVDLARSLAAGGAGLPRLRDRTVASFDIQALEALSGIIRPSARATALAVASVRRAALAPVAAALADEYSDFIGLLMGDESAALRHVFLAERAAQKAPGTTARPTPVRRLGIRGSDALATALAQAATRAGIEVETAQTGDCDLVLATQAAAPVAVQLRAFVPDARLIEVVRGDTTAPAALAAAMALLRRLRLVPVCVGPGPGLLVERVLRPYFDQAAALCAQGVPRERVDAALVSFGMRRGPFAFGQAIGHEMSLPALAPVLADPGISEADIALQCVLAMVNEAARALEAGVAQRSGDIDLAMVEGAGFPAGKGGPIFWAETRGLPLTLAGIVRLARQTCDPFWTPAPLLRKAALDVGQAHL
jgi:enoyl-CoA hydratase/carnithine racemase